VNDYIDYDEQGIKEIRCMICNIPVKIRKEINGRTILQPLGHYKEIPVGLSEDDKPHSVANIIGCKVCADKSIDLDDLMSTIRLGWNKEMKQAKVKKKNRDIYFTKMRNIKAKKRLDKGA
jgi:hypothetical protein